VTLSTGAEVVAIDYSSAVDACWTNLGPHPRLHVVQADIYKLPFKTATFDRVYCLGVLQHTPDVRRAFMALPPHVKSGGKLAVDVYAKVFLNALWPKYWLRPLSKRIDQKRLLDHVQRWVPRLLPVSDFLAGVPVVGRKLRYAVPIANHRADYPSLSDAQIAEWAVLNTYDMLSPAYDQPQSATTLRRWFEEAGLQDVKVYRKGHLIGHGVR
jgi:SAM-dependent methyltransferase